jgi:hypothetical protein
MDCRTSTWCEAIKFLALIIFSVGILMMAIYFYEPYYYMSLARQEMEIFNISTEKRDFNVFNEYLAVLRAEKYYRIATAIGAAKDESLENDIFEKKKAYKEVVDEKKRELLANPLRNIPTKLR